MIILKGQVPHTTHSYTKNSHKKKRVEKERQQKKATSIKQRKAILAIFGKMGTVCTPNQALQAMMRAQGFLRPASVSIYKDKKFNVRQLKVHPLATLKNKNLFAR